VRDCGMVSFEDELAQRNDQACVPSWFGVEIKTGVCCCIRYSIQAARGRGLCLRMASQPIFDVCYPRGVGSDYQP
jgi:hypothetical protein